MTKFLNEINNIDITNMTYMIKYNTNENIQGFTYTTLYSYNTGGKYKYKSISTCIHCGNIRCDYDYLNKYSKNIKCKCIPNMPSGIKYKYYT